jgi:PAS domain S-box-containing protein
MLSEATIISPPSAGFGQAGRQENEWVLKPDDLIVSKTDPNSYITYANSDFCHYSGYTEKELLGKPHNLVRHPGMPRAMFELMWSHLKEGQEFFGYIKNQRKDGGFYWTFASVAPFYGASVFKGYLSIRRKARPEVVAKLEPLYQRMLDAELGQPKGQQIARSSAMLWQLISKDFDSYAEFILSL